MSETKERENIWNRIKDSLKTDELFHENEKQANRLGEMVLLSSGLILAAVFVMSVLGFVPLARDTIFPPTIQGVVEITILLIICRIVRNDAWWLKYLLIIALITVYARLDMMLTHKAAILMVIPIVFSSRYFSKKLTVLASVLTVIAFFISSWLGATRGMIDLNIVSMPAGQLITATGGFLGDAVKNSGVSSEMLIRNTLLYNYIPKCLMFLIVSIISFNIARRGKDMVLKQHEKDVRSARIEYELNLANRIQNEMLPTYFPAFPERNDFDIYALMRPAKEVGGDFYDFFLVDDDHLAIVIADVSGKGIPAALFMMISKILVQNAAMNRFDPADILMTVNEQICSNNREEMFVTLWLAILDLKTGTMTTANAGHEYPVVRKNNGDFELVKDKHGFVLGALKDSVYSQYDMILSPGDSLFVYTDGVPEAVNNDNEFFGNDRLLASLNRCENKDPRQVIETVLNDVDSFVGQAEQFDDITMLCLNYYGKNKRKLIFEEKLPAEIGCITALTDRINTELEKLDCPLKARNQIDIAIDEIFANIASYAYEGEKGDAVVRMEYDEEKEDVILTFIDEGMPYDPLKTAEPDITLNAQERQIGGLGVFIVKKTMDKLEYVYENNRNVLEIRKSIKKGNDQ